MCVHIILLIFIWIWFFFFVFRFVWFFCVNYEMSPPYLNEWIFWTIERNNLKRGKKWRIIHSIQKKDVQNQNSKDGQVLDWGNWRRKTIQQLIEWMEFLALRFSTTTTRTWTPYPYMLHSAIHSRFPMCRSSQQWASDYMNNPPWGQWVVNNKCRQEVQNQNCNFSFRESR